MENSRQLGSSSFSSSSSSSSYSSSSSIAMELFGPKESSSSSSSNSIFGSVFGLPPTGKGRDSATAGKPYSTGHVSHGSLGNSAPNSNERSCYYQQETVGPCNLSSSIYYGGQDVYSPSTCTPDSQPTFKRDEQDDDPDGRNLHSASRGNWWQGSLYY
ncbi:hypothetical protein Nepgr_006084 [Nepenthes gracilis]|uniref:Uncharacterized protein n=1 Tax=Nepenthes gracilis TaxID=150966 RepID=A0AAD3XH27_NEPGR|nr:hypothetical protein Nepgr_006084 [Nepenthes gracilis]